MKNIKTFCLFLCTVLCLQCIMFPVNADESNYDISVAQGCNGLDAAVPYLGTQQKISNAEAIMLYEVNTDTLMYAWNADAPMYPASLVKIMTALLAAQKGNMADLVTVKASTLATVPTDATSVELLADEVLTLDQLMYCLLVGSGNDAAAVIAEHIAGSQSAFVSLMNQYAAELGCTATNFTNVHGLHDDNQVTTARDMTRIMAAAAKNDVFCTYFETSEYTVEQTNKSEARDLTSSDHMMHMKVYEIYYDERVAGGRTGITNDGKSCLGTLARKGNMELVCIVMGSSSKYVEGTYIVDRLGCYDETKMLLDLGFQNVETAQIFYPQQALLQYTVTNGSADVILGPYTSASSVLPAGTQMKDLSFRYSDPIVDLTAPIEKGTHISNVEVWVGGSCVAYAQLYALNQVSVRQVNTLETHYEDGNGGIGTVVTVILVIVILGIAVLLLVRYMNRKRPRTARNRRHK